jgi:hypothetical protein
MIQKEDIQKAIAEMKEHTIKIEKNYKDTQSEPVLVENDKIGMQYLNFLKLLVMANNRIRELETYLEMYDKFKDDYLFNKDLIDLLK